MNSCYKVRACRSSRECDYVYHKDVIQTINHESSFSFALMLNDMERQGSRMKCPTCGERMYYYPVTTIAEPVHYE